MSEINRLFRKSKIQKKVKKVMTEKNVELKPAIPNENYEGYERIGVEKPSKNKSLEDLKYTIRNILSNSKLSPAEKNIKIYEVLR